jgi:hypothetical protein
MYEMQRLREPQHANATVGDSWDLVRPGMIAGEATTLVPGLQFDEGEGLLLCAGAPGIALNLSEDDPDRADVPPLRIVAISVTPAAIDSAKFQLGQWRWVLARGCFCRLAVGKS